MTSFATVSNSIAMPHTEFYTAASSQLLRDYYHGALNIVYLLPVTVIASIEVFPY